MAQVEAGGAHQSRAEQTHAPAASGLDGAPCRSPGCQELLRRPKRLNARSVWRIRGAFCARAQKRKEQVMRKKNSNFLTKFVARTSVTRSRGNWNDRRVPGTKYYAQSTRCGVQHHWAGQSGTSAYRARRNAARRTRRTGPHPYAPTPNAHAERTVCPVLIRTRAQDAPCALGIRGLVRTSLETKSCARGRDSRRQVPETIGLFDPPLSTPSH